MRPRYAGQACTDETNNHEGDEMNKRLIAALAAALLAVGYSAMPSMSYNECLVKNNVKNFGGGSSLLRSYCHEQSNWGW